VYASYAFILPLVVFIGFGLKLILDRKMKYFSFVVPAVVIAIALSYGARFAFDNFLEPHQQERINVWLSPEKCDPRGSLYNIIQSKLAIGSGGVMGKGYLEGEMTKLNFVPEQTTDFIFSTVGEEQGFIGSVAIILLFLILISRMVIMAERTRFEFVRNFGYCLAGIFFFHFFINIGMTVGIMPVIGIPLPFLSKGGSSLLMFSLLVAIMLRMDVERTTK
jgi:rod shape determining protein RodA